VPATAPYVEQDRPLIGCSSRLQHLRRQIEKAARSRWPVLILGETGTGKEVVARAIHQEARTGPFVTIDCSSLVGPLMESELFGHSKGAFTGAAGQKLGMLEMADGGTAFLDEIGELPLDVQAKLLRALQEKEFRPVGSVSQRKSDFRIIAATNRDLAREVAGGSFRRDLYYRLNVLTIRLQPLRERKEDIPALVEHFLGLHGCNHVMTPEAIHAFMSYDWPGNVRELENTVQQMVAMNSGPLLHTFDLPSQLRNHIEAQRQPAIAAVATAPIAHTAGISALARAVGPVTTHAIIPLPELERRAILDALRYTKGDRSTAATLLGIGRTTLYRKLKDYNMAEDGESEAGLD
jgi:DNA-binding NtrC family response regulator